MAEVNGPVQEKIATFGEGRGLVGVLTLPGGRRLPGAPQVILLSTGILHRVGSNRLWVSLARALGAAGITTLRFDLSGIGDSERRRDVTSLRESVERDIRDAIDYLATTQGADRVILMGLCSGAYDALHATLGEERVVGAVLVDTPGRFRSWRSTMYHLGSRLLRPASWRNPLRKVVHYGRLLLWLGGVRQEDVQGYEVGARHSMARERLRGELAAVLERQVRLYVVFTRGLEANYSHRSQFRFAFPRAARHPALSFDYFEDADHAFSRAQDRVRLLECIVRWVVSQPFVEVGKSEARTLTTV
jgi:pimeloyl-ACP methyl ester carboxylesterase